MTDQDTCCGAADQMPPASESASSHRSSTTQITLLTLGVTAIAAVAAFVVVRSLLAQRAPVDPTTERIKVLLAEANLLLKHLDEQEHR
ncbi:MAG TPA: hypothetical protein VGZ00_06240 [Candidatus Baltobacteraceae bacterium]|jgi:peptidoglycan biosynthesis protein MviN/MurJ (putative lipid II flippase)|nr:hypothetical protein [Candidatus Baltobacteraceae bacterium]